ncbi:AAA family ATPase [Sorangium sp. So ce861]|uniref:AAA family ATPase n=1 Tax=Sorangium sp. So ce861 TaxID=3133323 RepID=UPI003F5DD509
MDGAEKGSLFVPAAGVVLIDEMDMHLHVAWQQRIGFWLKKHFRGIQFIVTTHSPFICQAADPKGLIRLPAPGGGERAEHMPDELLKIIVNGDADAAAMTALFGLEHTHSAELLRARGASLLDPRCRAAVEAHPRSGPGPDSRPFPGYVEAGMTCHGPP